MIKGSCCCGAITFSLDAQPEMMGACHCSRCRKVGAGNMVFVKAKNFHWISGKEKVATYVPEEGYKYHRSFCSSCGTALGEILSEEDSFPISAHVIDDALDARNSFHEFVSEKPDWVVIGDDAKQFEEHPFQSE